MATTISTIYRAEVSVPDDVSDRFAGSPEYSTRMCQISTKCNVAASGRDSYSSVFEWAEDSSRTCVENFGAEVEMYVRELQRRMLTEAGQQ